MIQVNVMISAMQQRADHGHQHADGGQPHAVAGFVRRGQPLEPENEQHRGHQIRELDEDFARVHEGKGLGARGEEEWLVASG